MRRLPVKGLTNVCEYVKLKCFMQRDGCRMDILIGSAFPLSLIRRKVEIVPMELDALVERLRGDTSLYSFWGHDNTLTAVRTLLGVDLTPREKRAPLVLDRDGLPSLYGKSFTECWVVSPDYVPGFRPAVGEEVGLDKINGWRVLNMRWRGNGEERES